MENSEVNLKLKEEIEVLEKMYKELMDAYQHIQYTPHLIYDLLKLLSLMFEEQIKVQRGEESWMTKFNNMEEYLIYNKGMLDFQLKYLKEEFKIKD